MRKGTFLLRLALAGIVRNGRFYLPYLLSCGSVAAMCCVLRYLSWSGTLSAVRGAAYLQAMMGIGCFVAAVFAGVILLYANSFVRKRRQRELGVYQVLGLGKRHLAALLMWETALCGGSSLGLGLLAGIALSRAAPPLLLGLTGLPVEWSFSVDRQAAGETAALLAVLFALILAGNLLGLSRARPVELLRSREAGEREPRTKRLLALLGLLALGGGYGLAITTGDPVSALAYFFLAVLLVMAGTYCLFTAGSITALKALRANRGFYYQTRHFTAVSGLLYRMKRNAVGLANICILSTMVLVTVAATACLYLGLDQMADSSSWGCSWGRCSCWPRPSSSTINRSPRAMRTGTATGSSSGWA